MASKAGEALPKYGVPTGVAKAIQKGLSVKPVAGLLSGTAGGAVGAALSKGDLRAIASGALIGGGLGALTSGVRVGGYSDSVKGALNFKPYFQGIESVEASLSFAYQTKIYGVALSSLPASGHLEFIHTTATGWQPPRLTPLNAEQVDYWSQLF
jgi:hypothetical protein